MVECASCETEKTESVYQYRCGWILEGISLTNGDVIHRAKIKYCAIIENNTSVSINQTFKTYYKFWFGLKNESSKS